MKIPNLPQIFQEATPIVKRLTDHGFEAYFVGGSVRDLLLNRQIHDVDIATNAYPEEMKQLFSHTVDTGIEHGTVTVIDQDNAYEVTTFRTESTYQDYRRPDHVEFVQNLAQDLRRRDFTINAFAMTQTGEIIDLFNGLTDLDNQVIRAVGKAQERFHEDALRMMRAVRFVSQLEFKLEEQTKAAIKTNSTLLEKIAIERIREEFVKLGVGRGSRLGFAEFMDTDLVSHVPYLADKKTLLKTYQNLNFFPNDEANFWALIIILIKLPNSEIRKFMKTWKNSNDLTKKVSAIISCFDLISESDPTNRQLFEFGLPIIMATIDLAHILGIEVNAVVLIDRYNNLPLKSKNDLVVDGNFLLHNFSLKPSPQVGQILTKVTNEILEGRLENNVKNITRYIQNELDMV